MSLATAAIAMGPITRSFAFRPGTSDEQVIKQVFQQHDYDLRQWTRLGDFLQYGLQRQAGGKSPLIIDAGANIGLAALYFALTYPSSRIVAIEPEAGNFALLERNVEGLRVDCLRAALASIEGHVAIVDAGLDHWGYRTTEPVRDLGAGQGVRSVTMNQIYARHAGTSFPFIAKIDIEGAEAELFSRNLEWVAETPLIIIELHDWMLPKRGTARNFLSCIAAQDRDFVFFNENVFSMRNDL